MQKKKILVLDESGIFIRNCLGGLMNLSTSDGHTTGGVFGFVRTVIGVAHRIMPDHIICAADSSRKDLKRKEIFPEYKENREKRPLEIPDYHWQKEAVKRFVDVFKIERIRKDGYEADDIIASIASQCSAKGYEVYILSSDKDMVQLIDNNVKAIRLGKYDSTEEFEIVDNLQEAGNVLGVAPEFAVEDQALQGDTADNYPGGIKIGKVSAQKLINKFGTIEEIYKNLDDEMFFTKKGDRNALYKNLTRTLTDEEIQKWGYDKIGITTNKESILISREIAKLETEIPLELKLNNYETEIDMDELIEFFEELEFESLVDLFEE